MTQIFNCIRSYFKGDRWLLSAVIFLVILSVLAVYSSTSALAYQKMHGDTAYYLGRHCVMLLAGVFTLGTFSHIRPKYFSGTAELMLVASILLLVAALVSGSSINGSSRWVRVGSLTFQPSEIAKLVLIMLSARFLGNSMKLGEKISLYKGECLLVTMATGIAAFGVLVQPDLGTAAIIAALVMGMFIVAGLPARWITTIVGVGAVGAVLLSISSEYRLQRLHVWFDPWLDPQGKGYQMVQSLLAIGSGGLTGTNWGHGAAKFAYLPEAHTDFAFAVFCQENGFFGALILLLVFCLLGVAFYKITISTRDQKGFLLAAGVTFLIIGQAFANMAMVCGIFPVIGVPLIFISYGGSSMIISMAAIGLLLSVYDEEEKQQLLDAEPPEKRRNDLRVVGSRRWQQ